MTCMQSWLWWWCFATREGYSLQASRLNLMLMPIGKMVMDWHFIFVVECEFLVEKLRKIISCNICTFHFQLVQKSCFQQNEKYDCLAILSMVLSIGKWKCRQVWNKKKNVKRNALNALKRHSLVYIPSILSFDSAAWSIPKIIGGSCCCQHLAGEKIIMVTKTDTRKVASKFWYQALVLLPGA